MKRQKSNVDLGAKNSVAVTSAGGSNGSLIQAVCHLLMENAFLLGLGLNSYLERSADAKVRLGATDIWSTSPNYGAHWYLKHLLCLD